MHRLTAAILLMGAFRDNRQTIMQICRFTQCVCVYVRECVLPFRWVSLCVNVCAHIAFEMMLYFSFC